MIVQQSVFSEDVPVESFEIIRKYFPDAIAVDPENLITASFRVEYSGLFRGSFNLAYLFKQTRRWTNVMEWLPPFRDIVLNNDSYFTDFKHITDKVNCPAQSISRNLFVRPCSGYKEFSGNVYTPGKLQIEYNFATQNKNIDPYLICMVASPKEIEYEWRLVFINQKFVSGCQYMYRGELDVQSELPNEVVEFGRKLAAHDYFLNKFNFVIDLCSCKQGLKLLELNAFETSSFYACDLNKIYSTLANEYQD